MFTSLSLRRHSTSRSVQFIVAIAFAFSVAGGAAAQPDRMSRSFAEIATKVGPAVVSIDTKSKRNPLRARRHIRPPATRGNAKITTKM